MRKEILDALKAKFPGVSESILGRIADKLAKTATTAEQVKTAVEGVTMQTLLESYGDSRATEASNTARENAIKDYEEKHGLKDGKQTAAPTPTPTPTVTPQPGDDTPAWAQAILKRLDGLETARTTDSRRQQLNGVISKMPEATRKAYEMLPVDKFSEQEFSEILAKVTTEAQTIADTTAASGGAFGKPTIATGNQNKTELTEEQKAAISRREGAASGEGQPF